MESPFNFGKTFVGQTFVNREIERKMLKINFQSGVNTILLSPRRYGKSSLVKQVAFEMGKDENVRFVFIDFNHIRSEEDIYKYLLERTLKATLSKRSEFLNAGKNFFKKIIPVISYSIDPKNDLSVSLNWEEVQKSKDEILNLPEIIAQKKDLKIVICIDEFQNISNLPNSLEIEKELRSYWQHHKCVAYCLFGSRRHMMSEIFNSEERPFYRFGSTILLDRIEEKYWTEFIEKSFRNTGKKIKNEFSVLIAQTAENHPYYVQQLSHTVWILTEKEVNKKIYNEAVDLVIRTNAMFYQEIYEQLSATQIGMLYAVCDGVTQFSSVDAMNKYKLGTSNNVKKNRESLSQRDLIEFRKTGATFVDPFFKKWFVGIKNE